MRTNNFRKKKFLALFLSVLMCSSAVAGLSSCTDGSSSDSSSSSTVTESTKKDDGLIKNASFETFDKADGKNLIGTSVTGWTRSVNSAASGSALTSKTASGILDVSKDAWDNLTKSSVDGVESFSEADAKDKWDEMSAKDKLNYYEAWKANKDNKDKKISELDFYQSFNIDAEDIPSCENPLTHDYVEGEEQEDTNILMLHNDYYNSNYLTLGTAQKYTSSSTVTVAAGTSAQFSVWVKTSDLECSDTNGNTQDAVNKGAYISITNSVGGNSLDPLEIKNINTEGVVENNGWVQYEFMLRGSSYAQTTFTVVLGLGQTGGTDRSEYVNGYAFFDDIECKTITNETFNSSKAGYTTVTMTSEQKTFKANKETSKKFALDFDYSFNVSTLLSDASKWEFDVTTEKSKGGKVYTAANVQSGSDKETYMGLGFNTANDKVGIYATPSAMDGSGNIYLQSVYEQNFKNRENAFLSNLTNKQVLMLLSAEGAAYTANYTPEIKVNAGEYKAISFFVKTSDLGGVAGATVTLLDGESKNSISSIDTTDIQKVDIDENNKDIYDGWQQCFFFVENDTEDDKTFTLSFQLGSTTVIGTTKSNYESGFAAFTGFEEADFGKEEYACAQSSTYAQTVSLKGGEEEDLGDGGFDSAAAVPSEAIENGFANAKNYKGVASGSAYLGNINGSADINTNKNAGLLSREYADNYTGILANLGGAGATWESVFESDNSGFAVEQPLVIYNTAGTGASVPAYGFIGASTKLSADAYTTVSLRVKVSDGAKAYVYLLDMDDDSHVNMLSIGGKLTYWYDDNGNVCVKDPNEDGFNKNKDVAFKLQANGLYKVNPAWAGAADIDKDQYFANLQAYEKDAAGNLAIGENGVSYDYSDNWRHEGNDKIAFYGYDEAAKTAYAYDLNRLAADKNTLVKDFSLAGVTPRYAAVASKDLVQIVEPTGSEWATVSFYIHTGANAKNYRLEVWSGSRDGSVVSAEGSYVAFDAYKPDNLDSSSFATLLDLRKESVDEGDYFESVFSFYDNETFLRYDESLDEKSVGNSYEGYLPSSYEKGVAYLKYESANVYETFVDYGYAEKVVTPDAKEDDETVEDEEETTGEETNVWLLASSIIMAAALLLAVVSIVVRKLVLKSRKNRGYTSPVKTKVKKAKKSKGE